AIFGDIAVCAPQRIACASLLWHQEMVNPLLKLVDFLALPCAAEPKISALFAFGVGRRSFERAPVSKNSKRTGKSALRAGFRPIELPFKVHRPSLRDRLFIQGFRIGVILQLSGDE